MEFPHLQELVRLTSLTLACASSSYGSGRRSITTLLTSLCSLKELVIQKDANEAPLILCPTAELTKLSIACSLVSPGQFQSGNGVWNCRSHRPPLLPSP